MRVSAIRSSPESPPGTQSVAEMRTDIGFCSGQAARTRVKTSSGKRMRFSIAAAVLVVALVGQRRDEAREQVAVRHVEFEHVEARPASA